ncbi:WD repeat-containing protein 11 [Iris pallida]|uniref:WD repeat-containing protein 11 n=1 Tax=Iris pallida TaxID=29817 RepID=A0AAX6GC10_IRIPA|nr:WD repeat-containing protein 11 [Iris pallida]
MEVASMDRNRGGGAHLGQERGGRRRSAGLADAELARYLTPAAVGAQRGGEPGSADCRRCIRRTVERMRRTRSSRLGPWSGERQ